MSTVAALENFRVNLRSAIEARGLTQRDVAEKASMGYPYVNRVLQGKTEPSMSQCEKLADVVGLPLRLLLEEPENFMVRAT